MTCSASALLKILSDFGGTTAIIQKWVFCIL